MAGRRHPKQERRKDGQGLPATDERAARNVFEWLDVVRRRPSMYFATLRDLEQMLHGFEAALSVHAVDADVRLDGRHFNTWLYWRSGWSTSCGWAHAITQHSRSAEAAAERFFKLMDEFRKLRPTVRARVRLKKHHQATGTHCVIGMDGRLKPPRIIEVVQYAPSPLFFLRFHYAQHREDRHMLINNGREATSLTFARQWVKDEFQVRRDEWDG